MTEITEESVFLSEQRRFRRLEVSLPVWIGRERDLHAAPSEERSPWSLGYTRDVSMGGTKVIVPPGEESKWLAAVAEGDLCLLRFDNPTRDGNRGEDDEYIPARVKHAAHDRSAGHFWLGVQYDEGAQAAKAAAMRAGLASANKRKRWQGAFALAVVAIFAAGFLINQQRDSLAREQQKTARANRQRAELNKRLSSLARFNPVGTRAEGVALALEEKDLRARLSSLKKFSSEQNMTIGARARRKKLADDGLTFSSAAATGSNVELGVALPYGYAWPIVVSDLEEVLGRRVPNVVVFRDFKAPFPIEDAREARLRAKTLQITWEPWHFSNPKAVKLADIAAGKYDAYIDSWAQAAKSFGAGNMDSLGARVQRQLVSVGSRREQQGRQDLHRRLPPRSRQVQSRGSLQRALDLVRQRRVGARRRVERPAQGVSRRSVRGHDLNRRLQLRHGHGGIALAELPRDLSAALRGTERGVSQQADDDRRDRLRHGRRQQGRVDARYGSPASRAVQEDSRDRVVRGAEGSRLAHGFLARSTCGEPGCVREAVLPARRILIIGLTTDGHG
jgi:hypothetical protein